MWAAGRADKNSDRKWHLTWSDLASLHGCRKCVQLKRNRKDNQCPNSFYTPLQCVLLVNSTQSTGYFQSAYCTYNSLCRSGHVLFWTQTSTGGSVYSCSVSLPSCVRFLFLNALPLLSTYSPAESERRNIHHIPPPLNRPWGCSSCSSSSLYYSIKCLCSGKEGGYWQS